MDMAPRRPTWQFLDSMVRNRRTLYVITRFWLAEKHSGTFMGTWWALIQPTFFALFYLAIFTLVFPSRFSTTGSDTTSYALYLLAGLIPWFTFQSVLTASPLTLTGNSSLVRNASFPIELFPVRTVLISLFTWGTGTLITLAAAAAINPDSWRMWPTLPLLLSLQVFAMIGCALALAVLGVFVRDLGQVLALLAMPTLFLMPVFYPIETAPAIFRGAMFLNPWSYMVLCYQDVYVYGSFAHPFAWLVFAAFAASSVPLGIRVFRRSRTVIVSAL